MIYGLICTVPGADGPIYHDHLLDEAEVEARHSEGIGQLGGRTFQLHQQGSTLFADLTEQIYVAFSADDDIASQSGLVNSVHLQEKIEGWNKKVAVRFFLDTLQAIRQVNKGVADPQECRLGFNYNGCGEGDLDALVRAVEAAIAADKLEDLERLPEWRAIRLGDFFNELRQMLFWTVYDLGIQEKVIERFQVILGKQFCLKESASLNSLLAIA